jgi:hypothetical protein
VENAVNKRPTTRIPEKRQEKKKETTKTKRWLSRDFI